MIFSALQADKRSLVVDPIHPRDPALARLFGGARSLAGIQVNEDTALSSTALFAGVRFLSENLASVPLKIYRRNGRAKEPLRDDPRWWLLQSEPNPEQTAMEFREMLMGFVVTVGNAYAEIVEGRDGIARELWPMVPWRVRVERRNGLVTYWVKRPGDGEWVPIPPERMLHFRGFSRNGVLGVDVIDQMRDAIGVTVASERSAAAFFGNASQPSGILESPDQLSDQAYDRLRQTHERLHGGVENWHRLAILEEGTKWQQISTDPEKAQLIETRKFQVTEVARILNLPPHILKDLEKSTFSNIEHQGQELVTYTFRPWAVRIEQVYEKRLLLPRERPTHFIRHNLEGFLRGDMKSRFESYATGRQWGWLSANDVREKEDDNPIGPEGDVYMAPMNMLPADQFLGGLPDVSSGEGREVRSREARQGRSVQLRKRLEAAWRPVFRQRFDGLIRREANAIRRALAKAQNNGGRQEFILWLQDFYRDNVAYTERDVLPMFAGFAEAVAEIAAEEVGGEGTDLADWVAGYAERFGAEQAKSSEGQVTALVNEAEQFEEAVPAVDQRLTEWEEKRADKMADWETVNMGTRVAATVWVGAGIASKVWFANADACPLCRKMDGRRVGIRGSFLSAGSVVDPDDPDTAPLEVGRNVAGPPLHGGCDCGVVPGI